MADIAVIAPDEEVADLCKSVVEEMNISNHVNIRVGTTSDGVSIAQHEKEKGAEVIVSRGGTTIMIRNEKLELPVVDIDITAHDIIHSLGKVKDFSRVAIVGYGNVIKAAAGLDKDLERLTDLKVILKKVTCDSEISKAIEELCSKGDKEDLAIVGGNLVVKRAHEQGCNALLLKSTGESIARSMGEAYKIMEATKAEKERSNMFKTILDYISDGVIAVNREGIINVYNKAAESMVGLKREEVIGKHVKETVPNTRMHQVVQTGNSELGVLQELGKITIVTNRTPILVDGNVAGAVATFQDITQLQKLEQQVRKKITRRGLIARWKFKDIIGDSPVIKNAIKRAQKFAETDSTILITAETGTGKEMFAQSIHNTSERKNGPFVAINCASLPESLLEGELFGYAEGAFTGAAKGGKAGLFELAHQGTIFLDEIGEISTRLQILLLRVLQEKEVRRIGDDQLIPVDVRIVSASNQKLGDLVEQNRFREDLYYRLNVLNLEIPPLRDRKEDIPKLAHHFVDNYSNTIEKKPFYFSDEAMNILKNYTWPGNVRQLENVLERMIVTTEKEEITEEDVRQSLEGESTASTFSTEISPKEDIEEEVEVLHHDENNNHRDSNLSEVISKEISSNIRAFQKGELKDNEEGILHQLEKEIINQVLESVGGNRQKAARILGISSTTLWRRLKNLQ